MKIYVVYENGDDEELDVLESQRAVRAIALVREFLIKRGETRKIKSFEVEEDFL